MAILLSVSAAPANRPSISNNDKRVSLSDPFTQSSIVKNFKDSTLDTFNDNISKASEQQTNVSPEIDTTKDSAIALDDFANYDYDLYNYFIDLGFFDSLSAMKPVSSTNLKQSKYKNNIELTNDFPKLLNGQDRTLSETQSILKNPTKVISKNIKDNLSQNLLIDKSQQQQSIPKTTTTSTQKTTTKGTDSNLSPIESANNTVHNTTSFSVRVPNNKSLNEAHWSSSKTSISFEVSVETSNTQDISQSLRVSSTALNKNLDTKGTHIDNQIEDNIILDAKDSLALKASGSERNIRTLSSDDYKHFEVNSQSANSKTNQRDSAIISSNDFTTLQTFTDEDYSSATIPPINYETNEEKEALNEEVTTAAYESASEINVDTPNYTVVTTASDIVLTSIQGPPVTEITTIRPMSDLRNRKEINKKRPFTFPQRRKAGTKVTRNFPPFSRQERKPPSAFKPTNLARSVLEAKRIAQPRVKFEKSLAELIAENPSAVKLSSTISEKSHPTERKTLFPSSHGNARLRSNRSDPTTLSLMSQLGQSPHGVNPFGRNPLGSSPFGRRPHGVAPFGTFANRNKPLNHSGANEELVSNKNNSSLMDEKRYHVQVKMPDGTINGDYIILNHNTGSLSGVRYEAIDGADQGLIQQALLSFLSLEPGHELTEKATTNQDKQISTVLPKPKVLLSDQT